MRAKVVTLGTPFLTAYKRQIPLFELFLFVAIFIYSNFLLTGHMEFWLIIFTLEVVDKNYLYSIGLASLSVVLWHWLAKYNNKSAIDLGITSKNDIHTYSLFTLGDEAKFVLIFWALLTFIAQLFSWIVLVSIPYILIFLAGVGIVTSFLIGEGNDLCTAKEVLSVMGITDGVIGYIVLSLLLFSIVVGTLRTSRMAFGGESLYWHLTHRLHISVAANPKSQSQLVMFRRQSGLRHSRFYEDISTIKSIAEKLANWELRSSQLHWYITSAIRYGIILLTLLYINYEFFSWSKEELIFIGGACAGGAV